MHDRGMQFGSAPGGTSRRGWRLGRRAESVADEFDDGGVVGLTERDVALPGWRDHLAAVLDEAASPGEVRISRRDGRSFVIRPAKAKRSPLDVPGIGTRMSGQEIVKTVRASRRRIR